MTEEKSQKRSSWRFWKIIVKLYVYAALIVAVAAVAGGIAAFSIYDYVVSPGVAGPPETFVVPQGIAARDVGALLEQAGFIENEHYFRLALRFDEVRGTIRHGRYELPRGLAPRELLYRLYEGPAGPSEMTHHRVTIPEGLTIAQMAETLDDPTGFLEAARDPELLTRLGLQAESLEGFLMPNTYFFDAPPTAAELVERMVSQFEKDYAALVAEIPGAEAYDRLAIVTLASLVEEEARVDSERPLVAAVMYNRLERNMPLQMDSTLQYALGKYGQRMLNADKEVDSPYNTYRYTGLPPGPISNPGVDCIRAALAPSNVDYIFFVSNADGKTHTFSSTAEEHERAVARYRRDIREQRQALQ